MSGQQEQWDGQEQASQPDQPDQRRQPDGTLVTAQLSAHSQDRANGHARQIGTGAVRPLDSDPYQAIGETTRQHQSPRSVFDPAPAQTAAEPRADSRPHADRPNVTPVPGSWADLRQRLERLPYGHPSSPYHVDGERKPPPPRLKHLELAPPVPGRPGEPPARSGADDLPQAGHNEQHSTPMPTFTPAKAGANAGSSQPAQHDSAVAEQPRMPAASRPELVPRRPADPTADRRQSSVRSATAQARSLPTGRGPGFDPSSIRPRTATDGSWTWGPARLTSDQVRIAEDGYDRFRAAEGRSLFGSYGGSGLTAKLRQVEGQLEHGRLAPGTEERALLEPDVFRARFADLLRRHPDRSPELLASRVPGALSYAIILDLDHYADGILAVQETLESQGFELQARRNSWNSVANRCVFTMWHDPLSELPFEVQFHTSASLEAQQLARTSASLINDPRIPPEEAANLRADLASAWAALPPPPGNAEISDYRRYGSTAPRR